MLFKSTIITLLAASGVIAAPVQDRDVPSDDISVLLTGGPGVTAWSATGGSPTAATELKFIDKGPFTQAKLVLSPRIKNLFPQLESTFRCALERADGTRVIVTRGENIDFNLGNGGNENPWTITGAPLTEGTIRCDPKFKKVDKNDVNAIRVTFAGGASGTKTFDFSKLIPNNAGDAAGFNTIPIPNVDFSTAQVFIGPGIKNQALRCQVTDIKNTIVLFDRGTNLSKKTIGDGGKAEWKLAAASNKVNAIASSLKCGALKNE